MQNLGLNPENDGPEIASDDKLTKEEEAKEAREFEGQLDKLESTMSVRDECDVRVAVIGNVDSGKSTLVGVLTKGIFDDGRGSARTKVFNFSHE
jgi:GTPase